MIKNNDNEVKCFTEKGDIRWLAEHIANDANLMKTMDLKVAPSPRKLEPIIEELVDINDDVVESKILEKVGVISDSVVIQVINEVAEAVVAVKPRKQKTK